MQIDIIDDDIGTTIKKYRQSKSLTQKELSNKSGISLISIRKYEGGQRKPKIESLSKIAKALDVSLNELLGVNEFNKVIHKAVKLTKSHSPLPLSEIAEIGQKTLNDLNNSKIDFVDIVLSRFHVNLEVFSDDEKLSLFYKIGDLVKFEEYKKMQKEKGE